MFKAEKVLQIITYLLSLNNNKMNKLKLMKELYLIDRESIKERNTSLSGDEFFSLPHGPVLSKTLNMINDIADGNPWSEFLSLTGHDIELVKTAGTGRLSRNDRKYIEAISAKYINTDRFALADYTHTLPEWKDPGVSNIKIRFNSIMEALNKSEEEIEAAKQEYDSITEIYNLLGIK